MSRTKAAKILALEGADKCIWYTKRNLLGVWRELSHEEWIEFCTKMGDWLHGDAIDEWDKYDKANKERKSKSDAAALERVQIERGLKSDLDKRVN